MKAEQIIYYLIEEDSRLGERIFNSSGVTTKPDQFMILSSITILDSFEPIWDWCPILRIITNSFLLIEWNDGVFTVSLAFKTIL